MPIIIVETDRIDKDCQPRSVFGLQHDHEIEMKMIEEESACHSVINEPMTCRHSPAWMNVPIHCTHARHYYNTTLLRHSWGGPFTRDELKMSAARNWLRRLHRRKTAACDLRDRFSSEPIHCLQLCQHQQQPIRSSWFGLGRRLSLEKMKTETCLETSVVRSLQ